MNSEQQKISQELEEVIKLLNSEGNNNTIQNCSNRIKFRSILEGIK